MRDSVKIDVKDARIIKEDLLKIPKLTKQNKILKKISFGEAIVIIILGFLVIK